MSDRKLKIICEALKNNSHTRVLNLGRNKIGDLGAKYLSNLIKINKKIIEIHLSCNDITDVGAKYLLDALKLNYNICNIDLSFNKKISKPLLNEIYKLEEENTKRSEDAKKRVEKHLEKCRDVKLMFIIVRKNFLLLFGKLIFL